VKADDKRLRAIKKMGMEELCRRLFCRPRPLDLEPLPREAETVRGCRVCRGIVGLRAK
jgi:hypothetical protein